MAWLFLGKVRNNVSIVQRTEANGGGEEISETVIWHPKSSTLSKGDNYFFYWTIFSFVFFTFTGHSSDLSWLK